MQPRITMQHQINIVGTLTKPKPRCLKPETIAVAKARLATTAMLNMSIYLLSGAVLIPPRLTAEEGLTSTTLDDQLKAMPDFSRRRAGTSSMMSVGARHAAER